MPLVALMTESRAIGWVPYQTIPRRFEGGVRQRMVIEWAPMWIGVNSRFPVGAARSCRRRVRFDPTIRVQQSSGEAGAYGL